MSEVQKDRQWCRSDEEVTSVWGGQWVKSQEKGSLRIQHNQQESVFVINASNHRSVNKRSRSSPHTSVCLIYYSPYTDLCCCFMLLLSLHLQPLEHLLIAYLGQDGLQKYSMATSCYDRAWSPVQGPNKEIYVKLSLYLQLISWSWHQLTTFIRASADKIFKEWVIIKIIFSYVPFAVTHKLTFKISTTMSLSVLSFNM